MRDIRPSWPILNRRSPLFSGLKFAMLGRGARTVTGFDSSPFNNNGTLTNMDPATDWVWDATLGRWGVDYDGTDYIALSSAQLYAVPAGGLSFTIAFWFKAIAAEPDYYSAAIAFGGTDDLMIYPNENIPALGYKGVRIFWRDCTFNIIKENVAPRSATTWYHLCFVNVSGSQKLYIDGVVIASNTISTSSGGPFNSLRLGGWADGSQPYVGSLADPCIWSRALAPGEIAALADRSNVMLDCGGIPLIRPFVNKTYFWSGSVPGATPWLYAHRRNSRVIGVFA